MTWLKLGPTGLQKQAREKLNSCSEEQKNFYESVILVMEGVRSFMLRYHDLMMGLSEEQDDEAKKESMIRVAKNCKKLSQHPAETFHEAVQSVWFLFVVLQMESNASSFSPGRLDRHLISYYENDIKEERITKQDALEIIECMWLKFNEIVYMRNSHGAKYFAGFPIGFNIAVG